MNRYDIYTAVLICIAALGIFFFFGLGKIADDEELAVQIYVDSRLEAEYRLKDIDGVKRFSFDGGEILASPDGVSFESSSCKDKACVKKGRITHSGEIAVCVPNRVVIKLVGGGGIDAVSY